MNNNIILDNWNGYIEYIESSNNDIRIVYTHSKYLDVKLEKAYYDDCYHYFNTYINYDNEFDIIKNIIKDINDKKIIDYTLYKITIYTNKENIDILKENIQEYYNKQEENSIQTTINEYENIINKLNEETLEKNDEILELEEIINNN